MSAKSINPLTVWNHDQIIKKQSTMQHLEFVTAQKPANWPSWVVYVAALLCAYDNARHSCSDNHKADKNTWRQEFLAISTKIYTY